MSTPAAPTGASAGLPPLTSRPAWQALVEHHQRLGQRHLRQFFAEDARRDERLHAEAAGWYLDYSKQLNVAVNQALQKAAERRPVLGNVTLYPQGLDLPGTGLGSFQLNGSGAVLFEIRGQTQTLGQQYRAMLTRATYVGLDGLMTSVATGRVADLDPAEYDAIPLRGPSIGSAEQADEDARVLRSAGVDIA